MITVKLLSSCDEGRKLEYRAGMRVKDILEKYKYHPSSVSKFINGLVADDDDELKDGDELLIVPMIGGG